MALIKDGPLGPTYDPLDWLDDYLKEKNPPAPKLPGKSGTSGTTDPNASGSGSGGYGYSSGGGSGGGSGGSGSGSTGLSEYIQAYRLKFFPGAKPPEALLNKAKNNNWSIAYFEQQVRLHDPRYYRSIEARSILPQFSRTMKILFPGLAAKNKQSALMKSPFYKKTAMWYLKNGIGMLGEAGTEMLYAKITNTKQWNRNNPAYKAYAKNRDASVQAEANPLFFKQLESAMKDSFETLGIQMQDDYYKTFFKSRYASSTGMKDLADNLKTVASTSGSFSWFQGQQTSGEQVKTAAFDSKAQGTDLRSRMSKAFGVRQSFTGKDQKAFDTQMDEKNRLIRPTI